jgi:hypothetical protein
MRRTRLLQIGPATLWAETNAGPSDLMSLAETLAGKYVVIADFGVLDGKIKVPGTQLRAARRQLRSLCRKAAYYSCVVTPELETSPIVQAVDLSRELRIRVFSAQPDDSTILGWNPDVMWRHTVSESELGGALALARLVDDATALIAAIDPSAPEDLKSAFHGLAGN